MQYYIHPRSAPQLEEAVLAKGKRGVLALAGRGLDGKWRKCVSAQFDKDWGRYRAELRGVLPFTPIGFYSLPHPE